MPLGQWQWPWGDHRQAVGADARARAASKSRFAYVTLLYMVEMKAELADFGTFALLRLAMARPCRVWPLL